MFFFFKQKTAYEMRISDWSSDVCSSDLAAYFAAHPNVDPGGLASFLVTQQRLGPYKANVDGMTKYRANNLVISNITTFEVADDIQIKNVFGYTKLDNYPFSDIDGSPYGIDSKDRSEEHTSELQ